MMDSSKCGKSILKRHVSLCLFFFRILNIGHPFALSSPNTFTFGGTVTREPLRFDNDYAILQKLEPPTLLGEVNTTARLTCLALWKPSSVQQVAQEAAPKATTSEGKGKIKKIKNLFTFIQHCGVDVKMFRSSTRGCMMKEDVSVSVHRTCPGTVEDKESPNCSRRSHSRR